MKNVSATEDVFDDHFPGVPILPGALLVEAFEQATQLLVAVTHDFTRVARLDSVSRAAFRALVRPGDQLTVTCRRRDAGGELPRWTLAATALVTGRTVAVATLGITVVDDYDGVGSRLRAMHRTLSTDAIQLAGLERR